MFTINDVNFVTYFVYIDRIFLFTKGSRYRSDHCRSRINGMGWSDNPILQSMGQDSHVDSISARL